MSSQQDNRPAVAPQANKLKLVPLVIISLLVIICTLTIGIHIGQEGQATLEKQDAAETLYYPPQASDTQYPKEVRTAFVDSCAAKAGDRTLCACVLDKTEQQVPYEEFIRVEQQIAQTGSPPARFQQISDTAIKACR